jgi:glucose/mannose-6-phosphate isomerase
MGGSAIGGDLLAGYARAEMAIPFFINRGYHLPAWARSKTLTLISSYSGNTEETLNCFKEALEQKIPIMGITSGGKLWELCREKNIPCIKIPGGYPPRAALGYSISPLFALFERLGFIVSCKNDLNEAIRLLEKLSAKYSLDTGEPAELAKSIKGSVVIIYADGYRLEPVVSRFRCQLAENAKTLAFGNVFPELNHNEIVGWGGPEITKEKFCLLFLWISTSNPRLRKQMEVTREIISSLGVEIFDIEAKGKTFLAQMLSLVHFADWLSYYLAILNHEDPIPIERIELLKRKLSESEQYK